MSLNDPLVMFSHCPMFVIRTLSASNLLYISAYLGRYVSPANIDCRRLSISIPILTRAIRSDSTVSAVNNDGAPVVVAAALLEDEPVGFERISIIS